MNINAVADIASIITAVVALFAYGRYVLRKLDQRHRLEKYLKSQKAADSDKGRRTIMHLVAAVGLSEADILDAAFGSKKIKRTAGTDADTRRADCVFLEFSD